MNALPKIISPKQASLAAFQMLASTDRIALWNGKLGGYEYATELVTVDPRAPLEQDCLIVASIGEVRPMVLRITLSGRNEKGHRVKAGAPSEKIMTHHGRYFSRDDEGVHCFGRLVGHPRPFPRPFPEGEAAS